MKNELCDVSVYSSDLHLPDAVCDLRVMSRCRSNSPSPVVPSPRMRTSVFPFRPQPTRQRRHLSASRAAAWRHFFESGAESLLQIDRFLSATSN